ncbi:MAG TPA: cell cycle transcriptional regulator TrcR [Hyphomicrobiaceae bacterium]|nr:cell cycle transcriptional regulator TrcR [Hyphomicrobiaceae bacterium]
MSDRKPLMQKATAVWLVDNTSLTFEQIAEFCSMHMLEIKGIADGDVAQGIRGKSPVTSGELTRDEIRKGEADPKHRLKLAESKVEIPEIKVKKRPRYTPVSRRQDRPNAIVWLLRNHPELKDSQVIRLVGTTKPTIQQIRDRSHWNAANLVPQDPVTLGLCGQVDLDTEVNKAARRVAKERAAAGLPPEPAGTLLPTSETTGYSVPGNDTVEPPEDQQSRAAPTADSVFANSPKAEPDAEEEENASEAARVLEKLSKMGGEASDDAESDT